MPSAFKADHTIGVKAADKQNLLASTNTNASDAAAAAAIAATAAAAAANADKPLLPNAPNSPTSPPMRSPSPSSLALALQKRERPPALAICPPARSSPSPTSLPLGARKSPSPTPPNDFKRRSPVQTRWRAPSRRSPSISRPRHSPTPDVSSPPKPPVARPRVPVAPSTQRPRSMSVGAGNFAKRPHPHPTARSASRGSRSPVPCVAPPVQVCDVSTQTDLPFDDADSADAAADLLPPTAWLDNVSQMQGELAMAICSSMEFMAERGASVADGSRTTEHLLMADDSHLVSASSRKLRHAVSAADLHSWRRIDSPQASDDECDEVRSLSLSENGPDIMLSNFTSVGQLQRNVRAPDPFAMLTNGDSRTDAVGLMAAAEDESASKDGCVSTGSGSAPLGSSDHSAATTRLAPAEGGADARASFSHEAKLCEFLIPTLTRLTRGLDVVPEAGPNAAARHLEGIPSPRPIHAVRSCEKSLSMLSLSQVRNLPAALPPGVRRPDSPSSIVAQSDISVGSDSVSIGSGSVSAFTNLISPERGARRGLISVASMPTLRTFARDSR